MPTFTYQFDPTGLSTANRITNEIQVISTPNWNTYFVIIPEFAPFFAAGTVVTHVPSGATLVEGVNFQFTHRFDEATRSIGKLVYGSITLLDDTLSGAISISYNTVGGEWLLSPDTILNILGTMSLNPRTAMWTQVALYPAVFPPINHEHNADEEVVFGDAMIEALDRITAAIEQNSVGDPGDPATIPFANNAQALLGASVSTVMSPSTTKVVIDANNEVLRGEMTELNVTTINVTKSLMNDMFGAALFVNEAFEISFFATNQWDVGIGYGYVNGRRCELNSFTRITVASFPRDIFLDEYVLNGEQYISIIQQPSIQTVNLVRYSENFTEEVWSVYGSGSAFYTFTNDGSYLLSKGVVFDNEGTVNDSLRHSLPLDSIIPGNTYILSADLYALNGAGDTINLSTTLGGGSSAAVNELTVSKANPRLSIPMVAGSRNLIDLKILGAGAIALDKVQLEPSATQLNVITEGNDLTHSSWTKTNLTVASNISPGPWLESPYMDKLAETSATGVHSVTKTINVVNGQLYQFSFIAKQAERAVIEFTTGGGFTAGTTEIDLSAAAINGTHASHRAASIAALDGTVGVGYRLITVGVIANSTTTATIQLTLNNGTNSYAGVVGNGVYVSEVIGKVAAQTENLLTPSESFDSSHWRSNDFFVKPEFVDNSLGVRKAAVLIPKTAGGTKKFTRNNIPSVPGQSYTFMIEIKANGYTRGALKIGTDLSYVTLTFDLENMGSNTVAVTGPEWTLPAMVAAGLTDDWYVISVKGVAGSSMTSFNATLQVYNAAGTASFAGDGTSGISVDRFMVAKTYDTPTYVSNDELKGKRYTATSANIIQDWDGAFIAPYLDDNNIPHSPVKLATLFSTEHLIDRRYVVTTAGSILAGGDNSYRRPRENKTVKPNQNYLLEDGETVYLPPAYTIKRGDVFKFEKALGAVATVSVSDDGNDSIIMRNLQSGNLINDISIDYDHDYGLTIIYTGSSFEARF